VDTYSMRLHPHDHLLLVLRRLNTPRPPSRDRTTDQSVHRDQQHSSESDCARQHAGGTDNISVIVLYLDETASTPQHSADQLEQQTNVTHDVSTAHLES
jgi:hypothetical protein